MVRESDIRVIEAEAYFSDEIAREALRFGAAVAATLTLCHVRVRVENRRGLVAEGWGAVFLSHYWAFPSPTVTPADKDAAMRRTTEALCALVVSSEQYGHPIDLFRDIEQSLATTSTRVCWESGVTETMPYLGALVCMSPIDAAIHDAFGNVNGICTYAGYGADYCSNDLSAYLGPRYRDRYLADVLRPDPAPRVLIAHTVGHADALTPGDVRPDAPEDSRPKSLAEWIAREGLCCFKVKLRGTDLAWDIDRYLWRSAPHKRRGRETITTPSTAPWTRMSNAPRPYTWWNSSHKYASQIWGRSPRCAMSSNPPNVICTSIVTTCANSRRSNPSSSTRV